MKLEVGMYVRTPNNGFTKINRICSSESKDGMYKCRFTCESNDVYDFYNKNHSMCQSEVFKNEIKEPSFNIIDLIEEGDYVNGFRVEQVDDNCLAFGNLSWYITNEKDIKEVLTKEQYQNNIYKL